MDDGLTLNIDIQGDNTNQTPHLSWRERKKQAHERQAKKRQRYIKSRGSRPEQPPAAAAAGVQQEQQQQQQQQQQPAQQPQQSNQEPAQPPRQRLQNTKASAAAKPGNKRSTDTLHGYGAVLAQEQLEQQIPKAAAATTAAAAAAAADDDCPKKRLNIAETAAVASAAAEAVTADEQADIMALVQLNMSVEQQLEQEQRQQQQQGSGSKRSGQAAAAEQALPGVVEFGDAPDELGAHDMLAKAGRRTHSKQQQHQHGTNPDSSSASTRRDKAGAKQQPNAKEPKHQQQLAQHKVGEMAHAERHVPAEQRQQLFGDAGAAGGGGGGEAGWAGLGLSGVLCEHLVALNFQEPTQVQQRALPVLLAGRDALVRSPTGSGKTLAYLAPMLHSLQARQPRVARAEGTHALILVPTRELAVQVSDVLTALVRRFCWLVAGMLIGGEHRGHEKARLRKGVTLLVATPGRLLDHLQNTTSFRTERLSWLVLDEADRLLDLGFEAKLKAIIDALTARAAAAADNTFSPAATEGQLQCQTVLLSATLHPGLAGLASLSMRQPVGVGFDAKLVDGRLQLQEAAGDEPGAQKQAGTGGGGAAGQEQFELPQQLQQRYVEVPAKARLVALIGVLRSRLRRSREAKLVVFFSNCDSVDFHHALLQQPQLGRGQHDGTAAAAAAAAADGSSDEAGELLLGTCPVLKLHGDMKQPERTSSLVTFSKAASCVLLCTDVAARGLDFPAVSTIIQYDPSGDPAEYVHRVGRTARMGQQGEALLFLLPSEMPYAQLLQQQGVRLGQEQPGMLLQCLPALVGKGGPSQAVQQLARKMWKGAGGGMGSVSDGSKDGSGGSAAAAAGLEGLEGLPGVKREQAAAALLLQRQLAAMVSRDAELTRMATSAFRSFVRAYTTHPSALKHVFYVKGLHLGHLAASFGLREAPSRIGAAGSAAERKKRKQEGQHATNKREKQAWHKNAKAAAAMGRG